jgi:hypothetical protein
MSQHHHHRRQVPTTAIGSQMSDGRIQMNSQLPGVSEIFSRYQVNNVNQWEAIQQSLYDSVAYAAAGQTSLNFFQLPVGQGTGFNGGTKTIGDTNMQLGGQVPAMQAFVVQEIDIIFEPTTPGNSGSASGVVAQLPAATGAVAAPLIANDVYYFRRAGALQFNIGSKNYLTEAPLWKFPSKQNFDVMGALSDSTTAGATQATRLAFANIRGPIYRLAPASLLLEQNQNFLISLTWDAAQAITNPARVFVNLYGLLYRASQ